MTRISDTRFEFTWAQCRNVEDKTNRFPVGLTSSIDNFVNRKKKLRSGNDETSQMCCDIDQLFFIFCVSIFHFRWWKAKVWYTLSQNTLVKGKFLVTSSIYQNLFGKLTIFHQQITLQNMGDWTREQQGTSFGKYYRRWNIVTTAESFIETWRWNFKLN